jgi:anti-sigma B factor antagonist
MTSSEARASLHNTDPAAELRVQRRDGPGAVIVEVTGELDLTTAPTLAAHLADAITQAVPPAPIVLDLQCLRFLSSVGLALLTRYHHRCAEQHTPLRVVADHRAALGPIRATNLDEMLDLRSSVDQAIADAHPETRPSEPGHRRVRPVVD